LKNHRFSNCFTTLPKGFITYPIGAGQDVGFGLLKLKGIFERWIVHTNHFYT